MEGMIVSGAAWVLAHYRTVTDGAQPSPQDKKVLSSCEQSLQLSTLHRVLSDDQPRTIQQPTASWLIPQCRTCISYSSLPTGQRKSKLGRRFGRMTAEFPRVKHLIDIGPSSPPIVKAGRRNGETPRRPWPPQPGQRQQWLLQFYSTGFFGVITGLYSCARISVHTHLGRLASAGRSGL